MSENWGYCEICHNIEIVKEGLVVCCTHNIIRTGFSSEDHARTVLHDKLAHNRFVAEVERELSPEVKKQIREHVKENEMIPAMKLYRTVTGFGLVEAKTYVFKLKGKI